MWFTARLPGMDVKDLVVTLSDGILTAKGEKTREHKEKEESCHRIERTHGSFTRSFRIPDGINVKKVDVSYKGGVLTIALPKAETNRSKAKKIKVK